jgi:glycosyltransferase involved in cell wall biosynthesis
VRRDVTGGLDGSAVAGFGTGVPRRPTFKRRADQNKPAEGRLNNAVVAGDDVFPIGTRHSALGASVRVALIHDYLTQMGGAERVLDALHELFPEAPVFSSLADRGRLPETWQGWEIHESSLRFAPGATRWHRAALPLYPLLFRAFGRQLREFDVILSDSSAWSHQAPASAGAVHVCYCHSPARFLYRDLHYLGPAAIPRPLRPAAAATFALLRRWDRAAAAKVDRYVANSGVVAERIRRAYGREAPVVYPPVEVERFNAAAARAPAAPEAWYVVVSRLVPHKRVDLAVAAFGRLGIPLKVVGEGRAAADLRREAPAGVEFLGRLDDAATAEVIARSRGLVIPAVEDFGITAVEAQAAGRPVIALGLGGALESVVPGETGVLFPEPTVEALGRAVRDCEATAWERSRLQANAARFGRERFQAEMRAIVAAAWSGRGKGGGVDGRRAR